MRAFTHTMGWAVLASSIVFAGCNLADDASPIEPDAGGSDVGDTRDSTHRSDTPDVSAPDTCPDSASVCGQSCVDLASNPEHCGECGRACDAPNADSSGCADGVCQLSCVSGYVDANSDLLAEDSDGCETTCEPTGDGNEACDGVDNDCDGEIDEGVMRTWYLDADEDGYGQEIDSKEQCDRPSPRYVEVGDDCNDADADAFPGQTSYFATPLEDGSFDYDCDGVETPVDEAISSQRCNYAGRCGRFQTLCVAGPDASGWRDSVPECGEAAAVFAGCMNCTTGGTDCAGRARFQLVEQRCR